MSRLERHIFEDGFHPESSDLGAFGGASSAASLWISEPVKDSDS